MFHQADLGISKTLVQIIWSIAQETSSIILPKLDIRLQKAKEIGRYYQYHLSCTNSGGYFVFNANLTTFKHRLVIQISYTCIYLFTDVRILRT
jgi:hypothetical protein